MTGPDRNTSLGEDPPADGPSNIIPFRRPIPEPRFDVDWFYDEEGFFTDYMDEFDW